MFRVLPWVFVMLMLCATGCPSTGNSTDAAADRGLVDLPSADQGPDVSAGDTADADVCPPGQSRSCRCGDSGVGGAVCTDAGVLGDCDCSGRAPVLPPRLLTPHSVSRATTQRPTFRWVLPDGVTRARVTLARDRALTREARGETVTGTSWRPTEALAFGVWFWRVEGLGDDGGTVWTSATWEFRAPHRDTPVDSSWGTLRDFNGDGYDDFVVNQQADSGRRLVMFLGSRDGVSSTPSQSIAVMPPGVFEDAPSRMGDFNGDGLGDLAVSIDISNIVVTPLIVRGAVDVYLGNSGGIDERPSVRIWPALPEDPYWWFEGTIATGDFDGDGYSDLVTGMEPRRVATFSQPQIAIYLGSASGVSTTPLFTIGTDMAIVTSRMNAIGDYNSDGYDDLLSQWGVLRSSDTPNGSYFTPGVPRETPIIAQHTTVVWEGYGLAFAGGDLNGDGRGDVAVGSRDSVEVYRGAPSLMAATPDQVLMPPDTPSGVGRLYGSSILSSTDVNGDGFADLLVGAPEANGGSLYLYLGRSENLSTTASWRRNGDNLGGRLETDRFASGLDVNGDGFDDIITESINSRASHLLSVDVFAGSVEFRTEMPSWIIPNYRGQLPQ